MKITIEDINIEKFNELNEQKKEINDQIKEYQNKIEECEKQCNKIEKQIIKLFKSGYWWSYDIDKNWPYPKKYSIKSIYKSSPNEDWFITVKEVFKKKPWPRFTGEHYFFFEKFSKFDIYESEEEAKREYSKRICPKCGGEMGFTKFEWCNKCMKDRESEAAEFEKNHTFYHKEENRIYKIEYEDELTKHCQRGFYGKHFILQRLDTGEIIQTSNLWSCGFRENIDNLPEIKFIDNAPYGKFVSDFFR